MGVSGNMFSNFSLIARDPSAVIPDDVLGDTDGDCAVVSADVLTLTQHLLKVATISDVVTVCDMNADGYVDSSDLAIMQMMVLGYTA